MKFCPTCETRYDEEILRFCMKDGTPLVDENEPTFIGMPSEKLDEPEDEAGEVTVIRRTTSSSSSSANIPQPSANPEPKAEYVEQPKREPQPRIVVPMTAEKPAPAVVQYQQPRGANTLLTVLLTMIATILLIGIGGAIVWLALRGGGEPANVNTNINGLLGNENTNVNTDLGLDGNFNFNSELPTPSPTASPTPSPTATPTASPTPVRTPTPRDDNDDDDDDDSRPRRTPPTMPTPARTPIQQLPVATPSPIIIRPGSTPPRIEPTPRQRTVQQQRSPNNQ